LSRPDTETEMTPEQVRAERLAIIEFQVRQEFESKQTELQTLKDLKKKCEEAITGEDAVKESELQVAQLVEVIHETVTKLEHYEAEQIKNQRIVDGGAAIPEYKIALINANKRIATLEKELK